MIADWSPKLQKLKLDFTLCEDIWMGDMDTSIMGPLSSLHHLTHLSLNFSSNAETELRQTVLSLVGKYCPPSLTHLSIIGGYPDGNQEILSLILGETISSLLPNPDYDDKELDHLKVPADRLTPICSKLRELNYDDCRGDLRKLKKISDSTVAFALRHLPFLEYLGPYPAVETSLGIKRLYKIKAEAMDEEQRPAACERVLLKGQITNFPGT